MKTEPQKNYAAPQPWIILVILNIQILTILIYAHFDIYCLWTSLFISCCYYSILYIYPTKYDEYQWYLVYGGWSYFWIKCFESPFLKASRPPWSQQDACWRRWRFCRGWSARTLGQRRRSSSAGSWTPGKKGITSSFSSILFYHLWKELQLLPIVFFPVLKSWKV